MATDKYKELRNLIFNELGITKDDIRQWTKEAAFEAAERASRSVDVESLVKRNVESAVQKIVQPSYGQPSAAIKDQLRKAVAETLAERLTITSK